MGKIVTKFGGSSLADAKQFQKVKSILEMDSRRCYVVPSAPGRRFDGDEKVTDLLYKAHREKLNAQDFTATFARIRERYCDIAKRNTCSRKRRCGRALLHNKRPFRKKTSHRIQ